MKPVYINGFLFYYDEVTGRIYDLNKVSYTTKEHLTINERLQIRRQIYNPTVYDIERLSKVN